MLKFYYANTLVSPAPTISISQTNDYANDSIIGYSYSVSINGYIVPIEDQPYGLPEILSNIHSIQSLFSQNGNDLKITQTENNTTTDILLLKGGILKDISFPESANNWTKYSEYSITLEFNELILLNESISCNNGFIDNNSISTDLIDFNKYKISEFNDGWTFSVDTEASYNYAFKGDSTNSNLNIVNTIIDITYNISATGKNYFDTNQQLLPAWVQAKNFVQKRLYDQIKNLSTSLKLSGDESCDSNLELSTIHSPGTSGLVTGNQSLLNNSITNNNYQIYNETIQCNTSETNGTFSLTYNAKLKRNNDNSFTSNNTIHTLNKEISYSKNGSKITVSINVTGTIEGLCEGGLIQSNGNFTLPDKGNLLIGPSYKSKFTNANDLLNKILTSTQGDLTTSFKTALGINSDALLLTPNNCNNNIKPSSFNLTKNYMDGTINYSLEYNTDRNCLGENDNEGKSVSKTSIDIEWPTPIIAEFTVPGGNFILQDLNTVSAKRVSFSLEGKTARDTCTNLNTLISQVTINPMILLPSNVILPNYEGSTLTNKSFNYNPIDGSYNMSLSYICAQACEIVQ